MIEEKRQGSHWARLAGYKRACGKILAFIDGDCVADKHWLSIIAKAFEDDKIIALSGKVDYIDLNTKIPLYCKRFHLYWKFQHPLLIKTKRAIIWGANFVVRRSSLRDEYFHTNLQVYTDRTLIRNLAKNKKREEKIIYEKKLAFSHLIPQVICQREAQ